MSRSTWKGPFSTVQSINEKQQGDKIWSRASIPVFLGKQVKIYNGRENCRRNDWSQIWRICIYKKENDSEIEKSSTKKVEKDLINKKGSRHTSTRQVPTALLPPLGASASSLSLAFFL